MENDWIRYKAIVERGNAKGALFVALPRDAFGESEVGAFIAIKLAPIDEPQQIRSSFAKITRGAKLGFYPPQREFADLIHTPVEVQVRQVQGFSALVSKEHRLNIPIAIGCRYHLETGDILKLQAEIDGQHLVSTMVITKRQRPPRVAEYSGTLRDAHIPCSQRVVFEILEKLPIAHPQNKHDPYLVDCRTCFPAKATIVQYSPTQLAVHIGHCRPIIIPAQIDLRRYALFLGAYFADGTKTGTAWSINASTPEQAEYYIQQHQELVPHGDPLTFQLTYTRSVKAEGTDEELKTQLCSYWQAHLPEGTSSLTIYLLPRTGLRDEDGGKRSRYGSLRIRGNLTATLLFYQGLLREGVSRILQLRDRRLLWQFFFGLMEGDGSVGSPGQGTRAQLRLHTDRPSLTALEELFQRLEVPHRTYQLENKAEIAIGVVHYLPFLGEIAPDLFRYYPKRRARFLDRLLSQATIAHAIHGDHAGLTRLLTNPTQWTREDRTALPPTNLNQTLEILRSLLVELQQVRPGWTPEQAIREAKATNAKARLRAGATPHPYHPLREAADHGGMPWLETPPDPTEIGYLYRMTGARRAILATAGIRTPQDLLTLPAADVQQLKTQIDPTLVNTWIHQAREWLKDEF